MKKITKVSVLFAMVLMYLAYSLYKVPPSGVSWSAFYLDNGGFWRKVGFILYYYVIPLPAGFIAIFAFQISGRLMGSPGQVSRRLIFSLNVISWAIMWAAFAAMTSGGRPGYLIGMALGITVASQIWSIVQKKVWGIEMPWIIWRSDPKYKEQFKKFMERQIPPVDHTSTTSPRVDATGAEVRDTLDALSVGVQRGIQQGVEQSRKHALDQDNVPQAVYFANGITVSLRHASESTYLEVEMNGGITTGGLIAKQRFERGIFPPTS